MTALLLGGPSAGQEQIIGGPCEGCELVFQGMPEQLTSSARIAPREEPGDPLIVRGRILDESGAPVAGIVVYAYQTNAAGIYPRGQTRHGALRGWAVTDGNGNSRFDTVRPGPYPNARIPQHIHMHVIEPGRATYYIDDILFTDDPLLTEKDRSRSRPRGGSGLTAPGRDAAGVWQVRRDITLRLNIDK